METQGLHEIIIIIAIGIIACIQINIWMRTNLQITEYVNIFKNIKFITSKAYIPFDEIANVSGEAVHQYSDYSENGIEITYIDSEQNISHPLLKEIIHAINTYLVRNKGAVGDFLLIKDIVERYCDAKREEFETQIPIPLYMGLMGTMLGIIFGIGYIAIVSGFKAFIDNPTTAIGILMGGVAIAMLASLIGIILTTCGSWFAKSAASKVETDKNMFYTWIQTELLPTLGGTENSLMMLQKNFVKFNQSFAANTRKLDNALQRVEDSYESQIELINAIRELDIHRVATANVSVLKELQNCIPQLEQFRQYLYSVNNYIEHIDNLNDNLNTQLNRTQLIEHLGHFFEAEVTQIEQRKAAISEAVGSVDDRLQKTLQVLQENTEESMQNMNESLIERQNVFNNAINEQQEIFKHKIQENGNLLNELKKIEDLKQAINGQSEKLDLELNGLRMLQDEISRMASIQNSQMETLIAAVNHITVDVAAPNIDTTIKMNKLQKIGMYVFIGLGIVTFIAVLLSFILNIIVGGK